jgi:hypothetical protein
MTHFQYFPIFTILYITNDSTPEHAQTSFEMVFPTPSPSAEIVCHRTSVYVIFAPAQRVIQAVQVRLLRKHLRFASGFHAADRSFFFITGGAPCAYASTRIMTGLLRSGPFFFGNYDHACYSVVRFRTARWDAR